MGSAANRSRAQASGQLVTQFALVLPGTSYRVTVNSFLAEGGDGLSVLAPPNGTDRLGGGVDTDAFEAYLASLGAPLSPPALDRIDII